MTIRVVIVDPGDGPEISIYSSTPEGRSVTIIRGIKFPVDQCPGIALRLLEIYTIHKDRTRNQS